MSLILCVGQLPNSTYFRWQSTTVQVFHWRCTRSYMFCYQTDQIHVLSPPPAIYLIGIYGFVYVCLLSPSFRLVILSFGICIIIIIVIIIVVMRFCCHYYVLTAWFLTICVLGFSTANFTLVASTGIIALQEGVKHFMCLFPLLVRVASLYFLFHLLFHSVNLIYFSFVIYFSGHRRRSSPHQCYSARLALLLFLCHQHYAWSPRGFIFALNFIIIVSRAGVDRFYWRPWFVSVQVHSFVSMSTA